MTKGSGQSYELIGVSSWVAGKPGTSCGSKTYPSVFARITDMQNWIMGTMTKETNSWTSCPRKDWAAWEQFYLNLFILYHQLNYWIIITQLVSLCCLSLFFLLCLQKIAGKLNQGRIKQSWYLSYLSSLVLYTGVTYKYEFAKVLCLY